MVAAGFSGGEADQLRRAMASWGKNGNLLQFQDKLVQGMLTRGYSQDFAERLFEQMKGFGSYGFPESHAASFALLVYVSAWFKAHYPAAFYAAIINSQPMGFYTPSQLIQAAKRHNISILPIDVQHSEWDCSLHASAINKKQLDIRLGLRLIKGLSFESAQRISIARQQRPFSQLNDLIKRCQLNQHERQALIRANATATITGNRHQSHWQNLAVDLHESSVALLNNRYQNKPFLGDNPNTLSDNIILSAPTEVQEIRADYCHTGLTLRRHPMLILRDKPLFTRCKRFIDLKTSSHKRFVSVAGIVTGRQRPGTATGVIFLTLEDETGNINVVVWKDRQDAYRQILLKSKLLLVKGVLEKSGDVLHVIAGQLMDCSDQLEGYLLPSRDFH
jgi:error-prone DNA polymerase